MNSRSAAKKVVHQKPLKAHPGSKAKPPKKELAKVTKFPVQKGKISAPAPAAKQAAKAASSGPARPAAARPPAMSTLPPPPQQRRPGVPLTPASKVVPPKQSLARSFYWSELRVGDDLPPLSKPMVDRVQIARYAAAAGDFNRLHLDEPFAHALGFPGIFAPGALAMGFVGQLLTAWLRRGHVRRLSARFVKIVWPGDELTCRGRIEKLRKENGGCYADLELWAENQKGELVLRGHATCELYESPGAGGGDGGGLLFTLEQPGLFGGAPTRSAQPAPKAGKSAPPPPRPAPRKK